MTATSQSVFVFFASFSVVIIALDRMRFVVTPGKAQLNNKMVKLILTRQVQSIVHISYQPGLASLFNWSGPQYRILIASLHLYEN